MKRSFFWREEPAAAFWEIWINYGGQAFWTRDTTNPDIGFSTPVSDMRALMTAALTHPGAQ
jgi:hypothetical protein